MALADENGGIGMTMPVQPMNYGYPSMGGFGGFGGFGGDGWWIILLLLCFNGGGWGGFGGGFGGGLGFDFPWLLNGQNQINANTNSGFDHAATQTALGNLSTAVTSGFGDVQLGIAGVNQNICQTGNGIVSAVTGAQNALAQQMYSNQIADLERSFAAQTASTAGMNNIAMNLQNCCCENRAATADLKYTVATEACADRAAVSDALRDVLAANTASTQRILDQMCQDKIDAKNEKIVELQNQLAMKDLAASQSAQTAQLLADNAAQTQAVENYIRPQINPAYVVPNPYAYNFNPSNGWGGCGCGCNGNFGVA